MFLGFKIVKKVFKNSKVQFKFLKVFKIFLS